MGRRTSKPKPRTESNRVGRRIRVKEVRVIDENGEQLGILQTHEALARADEVGLQLVEVNPKAVPPVCKIMDYGKFKYESAKREREAKKNQKTTELKEVKFRPKTHEHDYDFKVRHVRRFIDDGDKVKLVVQFRGREITHPETGRAVLERVCKDLADIATVIQVAQMEGNRINMVLAPKPRRDVAPRPAAPRPATSAPDAARPAGPSPAAAPATGGDEDDDDDDDFDDDEDDEESGESAD